MVKSMLPEELRGHAAYGWFQEFNCSTERVTATPRAADSPARRDLMPLPGMVGSSPAMLQLATLVRAVAPHSASVLITGETGAGKELVAEAVHKLSPRADKPFVIVNCAAIPEALVEAELFGHTRGAFTGAVQSRLGKIHAAQGGSIFFDEVGELPLATRPNYCAFWSVARCSGWAPAMSSVLTPGLLRPPMSILKSGYSDGSSARTSSIALPYFPSSCRPYANVRRIFPCWPGTFWSG